jgi:hypothetical protein
MGEKTPNSIFKQSAKGKKKQQCMSELTSKYNMGT